MRAPKRAMLWTAASVAWLLVLGTSFMKLWGYEQAAGAPAQAPSHVATLQSSHPTLIMLIHPKCPCSRATIEELSKLMTECQGKLSAVVYMVRPDGVPEGWEKTDLWTSASKIPGVEVKLDPAGAQAAKFGAHTSGQALLYSPQGQLLFAGGITKSRGHMGDNAGRSAIVQLVMNENDHQSKTVGQTAVYGCPLFDPSGCTTSGAEVCRN